MGKKALPALDLYYTRKILDVLIGGPSYVEKICMSANVHQATIKHHIKELIKRNWATVGVGEGENGAWVVIFTITTKGTEAQQILRKTHEMLDALH